MLPWRVQRYLYFTFPLMCDSTISGGVILSEDTYGCCTYCFDSDIRQHYNAPNPYCIRSGWLIHQPINPNREAETLFAVGTKVIVHFFQRIFTYPNHFGRSQWPRGLRPLACWDCGFEGKM